MAPKFTISSVFEAVDRISGPVRTMRGQVSGFSKTANSAFAGIGKSANLLRGAVTGAVAAITTGAAAKAINDFATKGDEIAKTARMLGLSTDALQELRYAAGMQGVETEALTGAMKLLNNNLGQLKDGQGALYSRLKATNPQLAKQLRNVESTDEAFMILMDTLKNETNVARRAALAQAAFGKSGQELIKFADAGADGISALRQEAHKYGLVISEDAAKSSEAFSDSLSRLKQSGQALFNDVLGQAVTKLQPVIQQMADWVAVNKEMIGQRIDQVIAAIGSAIEFVTTPGVIEGLAALAIGIKAVSIAMSIMGATNPWVLAIGATAALITMIVANWDKITAFFRGVRATNSREGGTGNVADYGYSGSAIEELYGAPETPVSPGTTAIESRSVSQSTLDVNFNNMPAGTSTRQTGAAPGISVNLGKTVAWGM